MENCVQVRSMRRARDVREQLIELCKRVEIDVEDPELSIVADHSFSNVRKAFASGYFYNAARLQKTGNYRTVKAPHTVHCHPSSALFEDPPEWVIYHELVLTSKEFIRDLIEVDSKWLLEIAPHYYTASDLREQKEKKVKLRQ